MNIGTQAGSLTNHILLPSGIGQPDPVVGMGATLLDWKDRHPTTVIAWDGKILTVREDSCTRTDGNGMGEMQTYSFQPNSNGHAYTFRKNKRGMWYEVEMNPDTGRWNKCSGRGLQIGHRRRYYDYSF